MIKTHAEHAEELSAYQRRESDEERACADAIQHMWAMSLDDMDLNLRRQLCGRISNEHRARIQGMIDDLDDLDDIATTAPSYIL